MEYAFFVIIINYRYDNTMFTFALIHIQNIVRTSVTERSTHKTQAILSQILGRSNFRRMSKYHWISEFQLQDLIDTWASTKNAPLFGSK